MFDKFIVGKAINTSGDTFAWNLSRSILHLVFEEYLLIILHVAFFHWQTTSQMNFHVLSELYCWHLLSIALMTAKSQLFTSALTNLTRYMGKLRVLGSVHQEWDHQFGTPAWPMLQHLEMSHVEVFFSVLQEI